MSVRPGREFRVVTTSVLINTIGTGLYATASTLYFVRVLHFSPTRTGAILTAAGLVGLVLVLPLGRLVDRYGARDAYASLLVVQGVSRIGFAVAASTATFALSAAVAAAAAAGATAAVGALVADLPGPGGPTRARAILRSTTNIGVSVGAVLAGVVVQWDSSTAYRLMMIANGLAFAVAALTVLRLPPNLGRRVPSPDKLLRANVMTDRRFLTVTGLNAVMSLHFDVLTIAVPLWIVLETEAPRWLVSCVLLVNTALVIAFQVRLSRHSADLHGAAKTLRRSGVVFLVAWIMLAGAGSVSAIWAVVLVLAAVAIHSFGEMDQTAAGFTVSYDLAPEHAHGQYQAAFVLGRGVARAIAPSLLTVLCLGLKTPGWIVLGLLVTMAGFLASTTVRNAQRGASTTGTPVLRTTID